MQPNDEAHGRTTLIIRSDIKYYEIGKKKKKIKYVIKRDHYITFFKTLGNRFIAEIIMPYWRSRLILLKGRELFKGIEDMNLAILSIGEPTY
jgi:hypothetical protein